MNDSKDHKAAFEPPLDCRVMQPVAWMRKWAFDGEEPYKEKNARGRSAWAYKFKFVPVSVVQVFEDDVPLYPLHNAELCDGPSGPSERAPG